MKRMCVEGGLEDNGMKQDLVNRLVNAAQKPVRAPLKKQVDLIGRALFDHPDYPGGPPAEVFGNRLAAERLLQKLGYAV